MEKQKQTIGQTGSMTVRKPRWDWTKQKVGLHYNNGNPLGTHLMNGYHVVIPDGERYMIRAVNKFRSNVTDDELWEEVRLFSKQEAAHTLAHEDFIKVLSSQKLEPEAFIEAYSKFAYGVLEPLASKVFGNKANLAVTIGMEHFNSSVGECLFRNGYFEEANMPEFMREMMAWHAIEEVEHKSVCYDVFLASGGGYFMRVGGYIASAVIMIGFATLAAGYFALRDEQIKQDGVVKTLVKSVENEFFQYFDGLPGLLLQYFRPGFHPEQMHNRHLLEKWQTKFNQEFAAS